MQFQLNFPHSADELKLLLPMPLLLLLQLQLQQFPFSDALATIDDLYSWVRCIDDCLPTSPSLSLPSWFHVDAVIKMASHFKQTTNAAIASAAAQMAIKQCPRERERVPGKYQQWANKCKTYE